MYNKPVDTQFSGLPIEQLICGPILAAADAQMALTQSTLDYFKSTNFQNGEFKEISFCYPQNSDDFPIDQEKTVKVPILSITPIPPITTEPVDVSFNLDVKANNFIEDSKATK